MRSLLCSLVRFWVDVIATSHGDQAKLQAEDPNGPVPILSVGIFA